MKINKIVSNPPYNDHDGTIYIRGIDGMLRVCDKITVICPDAFANTSVAKNKIKSYSPQGRVWKGVGIDVSIFELDNNHHSSKSETPNGIIDWEEKRTTFDGRRAELMKSLKHIGRRCLKHAYVKKEDISKRWFNGVNIMRKNSDTECIKDFQIISDEIFAVQNHPHVNCRFPIHKMSDKICTNYCGVILNKNKSILRLLQNDDFCLVFNSLNNIMGKYGGGDDSVNIRYGGNIPIPDLDDPRLEDEEYIKELYKPAVDLIKQWENEGIIST